MNEAALFKPKPKVKITREKQVEKDGKKRVTKQGGTSYKFRSPAYNSVPDRIEFYGIEGMARYIMEHGDLHMLRGDDLENAMIELLATAIQFTEYKKPGEQPTDKQLREHSRLRARGFTVNVVDQRTSK